MHYFDPQRPRLGNDLPTLAWGQAIPEPGLRPLPSGGWEISLMLGAGIAHWFSCEVESIDGLILWLSAWLDNPEGLISKHWPDFEPRPRRRPPTSRNELSLDDIL